MKIINKFKGILKIKQRKCDNINKITTMIGEEITFPHHYFCVISKSPNEMDDSQKANKILLKSSTISEILSECGRKKALINLPVYLNLKHKQNYDYLKNIVQKIRYKDKIDDFIFISYFSQYDITLFYSKSNLTMTKCNVIFMINEFDSAKLQNFFKGKFVVILLDEDNKLISISHKNYFKVILSFLLWSSLIYFNFIYIVEIQNYLKI